MIQLTVNNSLCQITGLSPEDVTKLRSLLSYQSSPYNYYSGRQAPRIIPLISKRGEFPTGLLYIVIEYLRSHQLKYSTNDQRLLPPRVKKELALTLPYAPYPEQREAAAAAVKYKRGIISASTGTGKSVIAALIIEALQVRTLVVVPSLELKKQLTSSLKDTFGKDRVGGLGCDVAVENVDSLDPKVLLKGYGCVIIDEFHHSGAKTYRTLNVKAWSGVYHKIGLSATPFRSQENERLLLESVLSQVIYRIEFEHAVNQGYIVPVEAFYIELPKQPVEGFSWREVYSELVVENTYRNKLIAGLLDSLNAAKIPTLCLVKEIAQGEMIQAMCKEEVAFVKGENDDNRIKILEFILGERNSLIGTTGVLGEGIDSKPAEYVIIAGLGKSKNQFMQQVGRGIRIAKGKKSCKIILFKDSSHKWSRAHFKAQCKYLLEEYGVVPIALDIAP